MTTKNDCKGCATIIICNFKQIDYDKCPCRICIVKGMCIVTCDDFLIFTNQLHLIKPIKE